MRDAGREALAVLVLAVAVLVGLALVDPVRGTVGPLIAGGLERVFGLEAYAVPVAILAAAVSIVVPRPVPAGRVRGVSVALLAAAIAGVAAAVAPPAGGLLGQTVHAVAARVLGAAGSVVLLAGIAAAALVVVTGGGLRAGAARLYPALRAVARGIAARVAHILCWARPVQPAPAPAPAPPAPRERPTPALRRSAEEGGEPTARLRPAAGGGGEPPYVPPDVEMLSAAPASGRARRGRSPQERGELLVATLKQFGIDVRLADVSQGPTVTRFELIPPPGVKVSKIVGLSDDIALSLAATGVRIEAPVPGKSAIGIEVPNEEIATVWLREVLASPAFAEASSPLSVALGKDIAGRPVVAALDAMPHLLVAGATGSGKSVLINVLILSLLFRASPQQVRLLLVDPKVVELSGYNGIPHLLHPVVTDPKKASQALRWAVREMERRYQLFAETGVRDITRYNQTATDRLPYIVVIIDELADLMMVAPVEVEEAIARLAQMARAAGIHLVVATQRPSVDVITGTIKANIPSRIAFAVSSQVDSRTILDQAGAEKLMGRGDMLFSPVGAPKPLRVQGAYVEEAEIERVVRALKAQAAPPPEATVSFDGGEDTGVAPETDPLFEEAARIVMETRQASASLLQRRLRVGYTRAARLVDSMAERGWVGPADGARPRDVYLSREEFDRYFTRSRPGTPS